MSLVASVTVDVRTRSVNRTFDYLVPPELEASVAPGSRVFVSFGRQFCQGFVEAVSSPASEHRELKPILGVLDDEPLLTPELLNLVDWMCSRYVCTRIEAISAVVPSAFRIDTIRKYQATDVEPSGDEHLLRVWNLLKKSAKTVEQLMRQFGPEVWHQLRDLLHQGAVEEVREAREKTQAKTEVYVEIAPGVQNVDEVIHEKTQRAPKQAEILRKLVGQGKLRVKELGLRPSDPAVRALVQAGLIHLEEVERYRDPSHQRLLMTEDEKQLTRYQERALQDIARALDQPDSAPILLYGVTGSGKTEVYMGAIDACLKQGHGAIVLVPEISLTPQMVGRFTARFGEQIAVLHSGLSAGEKRDEWLRIRRGEARIVIGARSAVFAPVHQLKLIIVDEEHEPSYKQDESPRYDAREVAAFRKEQCGGVVIYGSATPSISSYYSVEQGKARLITLPFRVHGQPLPPITVVDMREELRTGNRGIFSRVLQSGMETAVENGHQAILFLNRRGYASFLLCRNCGETLQCPHCDIALTLHKGETGDHVVCHYCQYVTPSPQACPHCHERGTMRPFGIGTQQVEQVLREKYPSWRVIRMDVDTTRKKGAHRDLTERFLNREADVLIGTQMIAKGLDFPGVTFVGVIAADTMLAVPDYRSAERTFHLLTQVAGRAGRREYPGTTVIQTFRPENYAISAAARHDYMAFYRHERALREAFHYPPFCEIALFRATHAEQRLAEGAAKRFERELRKNATSPYLHILPATPSGVARVEDKYRYQVVVKYSRWDEVREAIVNAYQVVNDIMMKHHGTCILDVGAGRI